MMLGALPGLLFNTYTAKATDTEHVSIVRHHPDHSRFIQNPPAVNAVDSCQVPPQQLWMRRARSFLLLRGG